MEYKLPLLSTDIGVFDISLQENIVILSGDSATGKSYLYQNLLEQAVLESGQDTVFTRIRGINAYTLNNISVQLLKSFTDAIVVVDNADLLMSKPDILKYIDTDYNNQYILMARGDLNLHTSLFGRGELVRDTDGIFRIHYIVAR